MANCSTLATWVGSLQIPIPPIGRASRGLRRGDDDSRRSMSSLWPSCGRSLSWPRRSPQGVGGMAICSALTSALFYFALVSTSLSASLSQDLCHTPEPSPAIFQQHGIYQAQLHFRFVSKKDFGELSDVRVNALAKTWADLYHQPASRYGFCDASRGWILALPTDKDLKVTSQYIEVPRTVLEDECSKFQIAFAPSESIEIKHLAQQDHHIPTRDLAKGFLGISCLPKALPQLGPRLFYLVPIKGAELGAVPSLPSEERFATNLGEALKSWLSAVRKSEVIYLKSPDIKSLMRNTLQSGLDHDHKILGAAKKEAASKGMQVLSEVRVSAKDYHRMLELLWASPFHRLALLAPKARSFEFVEEQIGNEKLLVIWMLRYP